MGNGNGVAPTLSPLPVPSKPSPSRPFPLSSCSCGPSYLDPQQAGSAALPFLPICAVLRRLGAPGLCQPPSVHAHSHACGCPFSPLARRPPPGVSQDTMLPYLRGCPDRSHNGLAILKETGEESENREASQGSPTVVLRHGDEIQAGLSTGVVLGVVWGQNHSIRTHILSTTGS